MRTYSFNDQLLRLLLLRSALLLAQGVAIAIAQVYLQIPLPWRAMVGVLFALAGISFGVWLSLRGGRIVSAAEFFLHLLTDVGSLSVLLYLCGGSANPFVSFYLVPLVIAAIALPAAYAWAMAALTVGCYALLFYFYIPVSALHFEHDFGLHLFGMWVNFLVSALTIAWLVARMAHAIRRRDDQIARQREEALRNERIVALGTLAAGAAHELSTPLSTMAVVLGEMAHEHPRDAELRRDIATLRTQVDVCKHTITCMVAAAGQARAEGGRAQPLDEFLRETLERWRLMRPAVSIDQYLAGASPAPSIVTEQTLQQALISLLNNAADASPQHVELDCRWDRERLDVEIRDRGPGLSREAAVHAGQRFFTTKPAGEGNGIGLMLARATLERLGGRVDLRARQGGGACTRLELPLAGLMAGRQT
jgi:two-component system, sensor histidine kinase RegB